MTFRSAVAAAAATAIVGCSPDSATSPLFEEATNVPQASMSAASYRPIYIDGDPSDWSGIRPVVVDPRGDGSPDILSVSVVQDALNAYFLVEVTPAPGAQIWALLDTDQNASTGCASWSFSFEGSEAAMVVWPNNPYYEEMVIGPFLPDCSALWTIRWSAVAAGQSFIEFFVPITTLQSVGVSGAFDFILMTPGEVQGDQTSAITYPLRIPSTPKPPVQPPPTAGPPTPPVLRPCESAWFRLWNTECSVLAGLRDPAYYGVPYEEVTDNELLSYIQRHRDNLELALTRVDLGRDFEAYLNGSAKEFPHERALYEKLAQAPDPSDWISHLGDVVRFYDSVAGELLSATADVTAKILLGIQLYRSALNIISKDKVVYCINIYNDHRVAGVPAAAAYNNTVDECGSLLLYIRETANVSSEELGPWLENEYVAYRLVHYGNPAAYRRAIGRGIAIQAVNNL